MKNKNREGVEIATAICLEDQDAEVRLRKRIASLEKRQRQMKEANKIIWNKRFTEQRKMELLCEMGFSPHAAQKLMECDASSPRGFSDRTIRNHNANLWRYKKRLKELLRFKSLAQDEQE